MGPSAHDGARRRRARARRRRLAALALLGPAIAMLVADALRRPRQLVALDRLHALGYAASVAGSAALWAVLLAAAARRRGVTGRALAAVFVALFTLALGVQGAFHALYGVYLTREVVLFSASLPWAVVGTLPFDRAVTWAHLGLALGVACALLAAARRVVRTGRAATVAALLVLPAALAGAAFVPVSYRGPQSTSADLLWLHGLGTLARELAGQTSEADFLRPQRHAGEPVPRVAARPARPRSVVLILQESLRADVTCVAWDPRCDLPARAVNPLLPDRMPLLEMRSNAGTTAISVGVLWTGLSPNAPREALLSAPFLWDYAAAAGWDTAYFTNQDLTSYNARVFVQDAAIRLRTSGTELDPELPEHTGPPDALLVDHALARWGELREPYFAVVQLANVHSPYFVDEADAPYQPQQIAYDEAHNDENRNRYRDAAYASDKAVARLVAGIRATEAGRRAVLVFTSDHGESFFDDPGGYLGHTWTVREAEVRVPTWIDAPAGTMTDAERASVRAARTARVFHLDLAATLLDLLGLWDEPAIARQRARMPGHPLTRPERTAGPVPLTNFTWLWDPWETNFGMMDGSRKVFAQRRDDAFHCFDLATDPTEEHDLGEAGCPDLVARARAEYGGLPSEATTGRFR
jgi:arylsulfatase A-like enzyme